MAEPIELRAASVRDVRPLVRRTVRRTAQKHRAEAGVIVVGQFPVLMTRYYSKRRSASLRLRLGHRQRKRHVTWLLRETTRDRVSWRHERVTLGLPFVFPRSLGPKWIPLDSGESYIIEVTSYGGGAEPPLVWEYEMTVGIGEKRMLLWGGTDRGSAPTISLRRL